MHPSSTTDFFLKNILSRKNFTLKKGVLGQFGIFRAHKFKRPDFFCFGNIFGTNSDWRTSDTYIYRLHKNIGCSAHSGRFLLCSLFSTFLVIFSQTVLVQNSCDTWWTCSRCWVNIFNSFFFFGFIWACRFHNLKVFVNFGTFRHFSMYFGTFVVIFSKLSQFKTHAIREELVLDVEKIFLIYFFAVGLVWGCIFHNIFF